MSFSVHAAKGTDTKSPNTEYVTEIELNESSSSTTSSPMNSPNPNNYTPAEEEKKRAAGGSIFMFCTKNDIAHLLIASVLICLSSVGTPVQTILYGKIFGKLTTFLGGSTSFTQFIDQTRLLCGLIMAVGGAKGIFTWLAIYYWMQFGEKQQSRARRAIYKQVLQSPPDWFHSSKNLIGDATLVNRCIEELRAGTSETTGLLVGTAATIVFLFGTAMYHSWLLTLVILATVPVMAICSFLFGRMTSLAATEENAASAGASKILDWVLVKAPAVRQFNAKDFEAARFSRAVDLSAKAYFKLAHAASLNVGILRALSLLVFVQGFWFGNHMIMKGKLSVDQVFTTFSSCLMLGTNVSAASQMFATLNKAQAAAVRIRDYMTLELSGYKPKGGCKPSGGCEKNIRGKVEFKDVSYNFQSRKGLVLDKVNIAFGPETTHYVVGKSGSGKSTLSQLLMGFYEPLLGTILIDGQKIADDLKDTLRLFITLVQSDAVVFNDSVRNNVAMAVLDRSQCLEGVPDYLIDDACEFALLKDVIGGLGNSTASLVSSETLSGGQKQRLALARAKIRDPPILILDEAWSAVDVVSRKQLHASVKRWRKGKTTIIITHEYTGIEDDDNVVVMAGGSVKRQGRFKELKDTLMVPEDRPVISETVDPEVGTPLISEEKNSFQALSAKRRSILANLRNPAILEDLEKGEPPKEVILLVGAILNYCRQSISRPLLVAIGLGSAVLGAIAAPLFSYAFSHLLANMVATTVDRGTRGLAKTLLQWSCAVAGIAVADGLFKYVSQYVLSCASEHWVVGLRKKALTVINEQDLSFFSSHKPAEITALIMNDTRDLRALVGEFLAVAITIVTTLLVGVVWALVVGWKLALVGIAFVPLVLIITTAYGGLLGRYENSYKAAVAVVENTSHETLAGWRTIFSFGLEDHFAAKTDSQMNDLRSVGTSRAIATGCGIALSDACTAVATGTILYYGMSLVGKGAYSQSQVLQVITLLTFSLTNASSMLSQLPEIARGQRAGTFLVDLLSQPSSRAETEGTYRPIRWTSGPALAFRNLSFTYGGRQPALNKLTFDVANGETVAVVGASGLGKSTLVSLLTRLYRAPSQSVYVANCDLNSVDVSWLREAVAVVPQTPSFFDGTIYENLVYGMERARISDNKVLLALRDANIDTFVRSLPDGWNTIMGETAVFSTGQLQRLAIARALMRSPKVLVLDEATANLDPENANAVVELVKTTLSQMGITVVLVTHDMELMKAASRVVVLKNGSLVQNGPFSTIHNTDELYRITAYTE